MKEKYILFLVLFLLLTNVCKSEDDKRKNTPQIGISGGMNQDMHLVGDVFVGLNHILGYERMELNFGYVYYGQNLKFENKDVKYYTHGAFVEYDIYVLRSLYLGLRFGWHYGVVDNLSHSQYYSLIEKKPYDYFMGTSTKINIGYDIDITESLLLRSVVGVGYSSVYITSDSSDISKAADIVSDIRINFAYDARLGIIYKF